MTSLINIVSWSHLLACEVLLPGDLAVDLTAGKGRDTLVLAKSVGQEGQVVAFDVQAAALEQTSSFLQEQTLSVKHWPSDRPLPQQSGIYLVKACHSALGKVMQRPAKAIMANLGYLPGGDPSLTTRPGSTLAALEQSLELLASRGRLIVTIYPAHPGGAEEGEVVHAFFRNLSSDRWKVLSLRVDNCNVAPCLLAAERTP